MFDRDRFISVEGGLLQHIQVEALAETTREVKQQVIDYFSRAHGT